MKGKDFEKFCEAVESGETKFVENTGSHDIGKVLFCSGNRIEVDVNGKQETWLSDSCEETSRTESGH